MITIDSIQCPYCKYEHLDYWEYVDADKVNGEFKMECEECERGFTVDYYSTLNFTTWKE